MKKSKKRPFREDYNMSRITVENAGSVNECTGLMPSPPQNSAERAAYGELTHFLPEDIVETDAE